MRLWKPNRIVEKTQEMDEEKEKSTFKPAFKRLPRPTGVRCGEKKEEERQKTTDSTLSSLVGPATAHL